MDRKTINSLMVNTGSEYSYEYISVEELQKRINKKNGASLFHTTINRYKYTSVSLWEIVRQCILSRINIDKIIMVHTFNKTTGVHLITVREEDSRKFIKIYAEKFYNYYDKEK